MNKYMILIKAAVADLRRHMGRTVLSVIGVTIGIATVLIIFSVGEAIKQVLVDQVNAFGTDYIQVEIKVPSASHTSTENATGIAQGVAITTLTLDDAEAISVLPNVRAYYGAMMDQANVQYGSYNENVFIYGAGASFIDIDPGRVEKGRFYTEEEDRSAASVVVLGSSIAQSIFGDDDPIGRSVRIKRNNFRVIGVMEKKGANFIFDQDRMIYAPVRTVQRRLLGVDYLSFIFIQVHDTGLSDLTAAQVTDILRDRHNITNRDRDDFAVTTAEEAISILGDVTGTISLLLLLIASISLIVGSVGIMNIMFVTVTERVPEIGLRKAVGATPQRIRNQFLTEAGVITTIGGAAGIIFGMLVVVLVSLIARQLGFDWPIVFKLHFYIVALGVSILVGLAAGYYPAQKAAKLDPIDALRAQ